MKSKNLLIISSYPPMHELHSKETVGGAYYTKAFLEEIKKAHPKAQITVLAEQLDGETSYEENGITVRRVWKRGHAGSIISTLLSLLKERKPIVSFEAFMFGSQFHTVLAIFCFVLLKLFGKQNVFLMHQVLGDFRDIEPNPVKAFLKNIQKSIFYSLIQFAASKIIVFESQLKENMVGPASKITVIPLFIPDPKSLGQTPRKNTFSILYLGFIAPYKGIDWLINNWPKKSATLTVAGGINPNHTKNSSIQTFVKNVLKRAKEKKIATPGFVREKDLPNFFARANAIILPYKTLMSSSGPLSLAFSYGKPVIFSKKLEGYKKTPDFQKALRDANISMENITFDFTRESLSLTLAWVQNHDAALVKFAQTMKKLRNKEVIAEKLYEEFI